MGKVLKPYTIVPDELYIHRDADRQVKNIIADMGRPGYVLVSRQMGKTNLLLNAKNKLETLDDAYVYIDLSNTYPTAKGCFENIIDHAIDAFPEKFGEAGEVIRERRKQLKDTPPHKQHTNELRFLLQALKGGKMVIILDEIDALTKTDYSDQIFSQIRSTYFGARVNYKEFYNLTYLLSGVVEPSEIIKDPKVSPFNIGQKIYLNDFSRDEFDAFIEAANLSIDKESSDRIFYWTNGNPRISWDVCSEVENRLKKEACDAKLIDKIVHELYLTSFDKAPIDNIREIIINDREIRDAIVEIEYKKGKQVSDKVKNKLYLTGIINYDDDDIHIKNEVIRKSLSQEWIRTLEESEKGLLKIAIDLYNERRYFEALDTFEKFLKDNELPEGIERAHTFYIIGQSAYAIGEYEKALIYFERADFDAENEAMWYNRNLIFKGLTFSGLKRYEDSLKCLQPVVKGSKKDSGYAIALINYGDVVLKSGSNVHHDEARKLFDEIINETGLDRKKLKDSSVNELKTVAYYHLAQLDKAYGDVNSAIENYKSAISLCDTMTKPCYTLALLKVSQNVQENYDYLDQLVDAITSGSIAPTVGDPERPHDFNYDEFREICVFTLDQSSDEMFQKIEPHLAKLGDQTKWKHLFDLAIFNIHNDNAPLDKTKKILNRINEAYKLNTGLVDDELIYNTLKLLAYGTNRNEQKDYYTDYAALFIKKRFSEVDYLDTGIFVNLVLSLVEKAQYKEALKYASIIESVKDDAPEEVIINYLAVYQLQLTIYSRLNDQANSIRKARQIIELADNKTFNKHYSYLLGDSGAAIIRDDAEQVLRPKTKIQPIKNLKVYKRNDTVKVRYRDGTILETKFKKIENDIVLGECMILG